jgi:hypothetical protein
MRLISLCCVVTAVLLAQDGGLSPTAAAAKKPAVLKKAAAKPAGPPAKELFGTAKTPASLNARSIGFYAKGCLAGATSGPSRSRKPTYFGPRAMGDQDGVSPAPTECRLTTRDAGDLRPVRGTCLQSQCPPFLGWSYPPHCAHAATGLAVKPGSNNHTSRSALP